MRARGCWRIAGAILASVACSSAPTGPAPTQPAEIPAPPPTPLACAACDGASCYEGVCGGADVVALAAGTAHACALLAAGSVRCWGSDFYRQLGRAGPERAVCHVFGEPIPCAPAGAAVRIDGLSSIIALAAGGATSCALREDGRALCWGSNDSGQLGHRPGEGGDDLCGTVPCSAAPSLVEGVPAFRRLAVGLGYACGVADDGVYCWGRNDLAQLGRGVDGEPLLPGPRTLAGAVDDLALRAHACAIVGGDALVCWGSDRHSEVTLSLGLERPTPECYGGITHCARSPVPMALAEGTGRLRSLALVDAATCVVEESGAVQCGGYASAGALGTGAEGSSVRPFVRVDGLDAVERIAGGAGHFCAFSPGETKCWGASHLGQLGVGSSAASDCDPQAPACRAFPLRVELAPAPAQVAAGGDFTLVAAPAGLFGWGLSAAGQTGHAAGTASDVACSIAPDIPAATCAFAPAPADVRF